MNRDSIDFETERISVLFRKILIPTLLGCLSISAVTAIDGITVPAITASERAARLRIVKSLILN